MCASVLSHSLMCQHSWTAERRSRWRHFATRMPRRVVRHRTCLPRVAREGVILRRVRLDHVRNETICMTAALLLLTDCVVTGRENGPLMSVMLYVLHKQ